MERGVRRGPGRPRASRRPSSSSSSAQHHPYNPSSSSAANNDSLIPQLDSPTTEIHVQARTTPSSRGRVRAPASTIHNSPSSATQSTPTMDPAYRSASRSERVPKQTALHHSLTFSTPENPRGGASVVPRKRARTFDPASIDGNADDESEINKGGHSLRKKKRIDYGALMNEDEVQPEPLPPRTEITVSARGGRRGRRPTIDPGYDADEVPVSTAPKKRGKQEKQRTASPGPSRRKSQHQRKPSAPVKPHIDQPSQSDTELKDTIMVGMPRAPLSSSDDQLSDPVSPESVPSIDRDENADKTINTPGEADRESRTPGSTLPFEPEFQDEVTRILSENIGSRESASDVPRHLFQARDQPPQQQQQQPAAPDSGISVSVSARDLDAAVPQPDEPSNADLSNNHASNNEPVSWVPQAQVSATDIAFSPARPEVFQEPVRGVFPSPHTIRSKPNRHFSPGRSRVEQVANRIPSSQDTETASDNEAAPTSAAQENEATASSVVDVQLNNNQEQDGELQMENEIGNEDLELPQQAPKSAPRTRRRGGRSANTSSPVRERLPRAARRASKIFEVELPDETTAEQTGEQLTAPTVPTVSQSPETRRKRAQRLQETEAPKRPTRERREKAVARVEAPKSVAPPRDFSFLTAYLDAQQVLYPEIAEDSGVPTPADTPALQASEPVDNLVENPEGVAANNAKQVVGRDGQDQPQPQLDEEANGGSQYGSAAPTPAADFRLADTPPPDSLPGTARNSPEPIIEPMRKAPPRKQIPFQKIRSPTEFVDVLNDYKNMSDVDLHTMLAKVAGVLSTWQDEYNGLRLITDDEDNAARRRINDATIATREARELARTTVSETHQNMKPFAIKGLRVDRAEEGKSRYPKDNPDVYEKGQDQIAAQAWGFEWDPRPSMISRQDPIGQRDGLQNGRLRNRPKPSHRAAEAFAVDEPVAPGIITGKRTRKPRVLSDESVEPSRAATPVEPVKPKQVRRRRNLVAENAASENEAAGADGTPAPGEQPMEPVADVPSVPKKPPGRKRGPKPKILPVDPAAGEEANEEIQPAPTAAEEASVEEPKTRKRRRGPNKKTLSQEEHAQAATGSVKAGEDQTKLQPEPEQEGGPSAPLSKRRRTKKTAADPRVEIPPSSFYSNVSTIGPMAASTDNSRPTTSSSSRTDQTADSNYKLRDRRKRVNYSDLVDHTDDEPKPKRQRTRKEPTPVPSGLAPPPALAPPPVLAAPSRFINMTPSNMAAGSHIPMLAPAPLQPPSNAFTAVNGSASPQHRPRIKLTNHNYDRSPGKTSLPPPPTLQAPYPEPVPINVPGQPPQVIFSITGMQAPQQNPYPAPGSIPGSFSVPPPSGPASLGGQTFSRANSAGPSNSHSKAPSGRDTPAPSAASSVTGGLGGFDGSADEEKDYSTMTKSEKMSHSMKARWASGSMQRAVDKRKETLAKKKQVQAKDKEGQPIPNQGAGLDSQVMMEFPGGGGGDGGGGSYPNAPLSATGSNSGMSNISGSGGGLDTHMQMQMQMSTPPVPVAVGPAAVESGGAAEGPEYYGQQHGEQFENGA